jgi:hypothetical protein
MSSSSIAQPVPHGVAGRKGRAGCGGSVGRFVRRKACNRMKIQRGKPPDVPPGGNRPVRFGCYSGAMKRQTADLATLSLGLVVAALIAAVPVAAALGHDDRPGDGLTLVLAPPWGPGAAAIVRQAGGVLVGPVSAPFGTLASFDGPDPRPVLYELGAWAVRDGSTLALLCGLDRT